MLNKLLESFILYTIKQGLGIACLPTSKALNHVAEIGPQWEIM